MSTAPAGVALELSRERSQAPPWLPATISVGIVLGLLEAASRLGVVPPDSFPPITRDFEALGRLAGEGSFWTAVAQTLQGWAIGLGIAAALAIPLGILLGAAQLAYQSLRGVIEFLRPIPSVALIPLAVLLYGTGLQSKVFLVAFAAFWPILMQTLYGVHDVDPVATDTARSFGFGRFARLRRVTLPSAVPYIATGIRISSSVALILAITAELVIGAPGLGRSINVARSGGAYDVMYALIIATGLLGWTLNALVASVERRVLRWHPSQRSRREQA